MSDDSTIVITDLDAALSMSEKEAQEKPASLIVVGGDLNGKIFDLPTGTSKIGRSAENNIVVEFPGISRKHMNIHVISDTQVILEDLGSSNGTYVNNKKVNSKIELAKGDIIKIGSMAFKYIPKGDPERLTYDKLNLEAHTDGLTKCYNKMFFNAANELEVKKSKKNGSPLTLLLFDLDHFKTLNDNFGHDAGDFVLTTLADIVRKNGVRKGDIFARYGGEEFVILLPRTNLKQGFEIAERIRFLIESHQFIYNKERLPVTASVGVADYRPGVITGTDLFKRADIALYKSKENGRNKVTFYKE